MKTVIIISDRSKEYYKKLILQYFEYIKICNNVKLFSWENEKKAYTDISGKCESSNVNNVARYDFYLENNFYLTILLQETSNNEMNYKRVRKVIDSLGINMQDAYIAEHRSGGRINKKNSLKNSHINNFTHGNKDPLYQLMVLFLGKFLSTYCNCSTDEIKTFIFSELKESNNLENEEIIKIYNKLANYIERNVVYDLSQIKYSIIKQIIPVCLDMQGLIDTDFNTNYAIEIFSSHSQSALSKILEDIKQLIIGNNNTVKDIVMDLIFRETGTMSNSDFDSIYKELEDIFSDSHTGLAYPLYSTILNIFKNLEQGSIENIKIDKKGTNLVYQWTMAVDKALSNIIEFSRSIFEELD